MNKECELLIRYYSNYFSDNRNKKAKELTVKEVLIVVKFDSKLKDIYGFRNISTDFVKKYCEFQFLYWSKLKTRFGSYVPISWVYGDKAFKRWQSKHKVSDYIVNTTIDNIATQRISNIKNNINSFEKISVYEEKLKKQRYDKPERLSWCILNTTLFHPQSALCLKCTDKQDCKKILQSTFPNIYNLRKVS